MVGAQDDPQADRVGDPSETVEPGSMTTPGRPPRNTGLSLGLAVVAMISIPLGLTLLFLAFTQGETGRSATLTPQTIQPGQITPLPSALSGQWNILAGPDSWVGYQIHEEFLRASTPNVAEGRTTVVDGGIVITDRGMPSAACPSGTTCAVAAINADVTQMKSDDDGRDKTLRDRGLQTATYGSASFVTTEPIVISSVPPTGQSNAVTAKGELTLHGVTKTVELPLQTQLIAGSPSQIEIVGEVPITLVDYGIEPPNIAGVYAVETTGTIQIHLRFTRLPDEVAGNDPKRNPSRTTPGSSAGTTPGTTPGTAPDSPPGTAGR